MKAAARWVWPSIAAVSILGSGIALWAPWRAAEPADRPLIRLDVDLGADVSLSQGPSGSRVIISPDGTRLAYYSGTPARLFTRKLDEANAKELPGTEGDLPFFSPDGRWIGITGPGTRKVSVEGGTVIPLANQGGRGASWGENGDIFVGLNRIPAGGGDATPLNKQTARKSTEQTVRSPPYGPQVLPGDKAVLFTTRKEFDDPDTATVDVLSLADGSRKILVQGTTGRYVPSGHLLYTNKATLFAIPFDLSRLTTYGSAVPILNDVAYVTSTGTAQYEVSRTLASHGTLVYQRNRGDTVQPMSTVQLISTTGKKEVLVGKPGSYYLPHFSPDGTQLVYGEQRNAAGFAGSQVFVWDIRREQATPLTPAGKRYTSKLWHPSRPYVLLGSGQGIFWARSDGAGEPQPLNPSDTRNLNVWSLATDGKWLAYTSGAASGEIVPLTEENGQLKAGTPERFTGNEPAFSPDSKWLAYSSAVGGAQGGKGRDGGRGGGTQLYVRSFRPGSSGEPDRVPIANNGGEPKWLPDGHTLLYRSGDRIMAVAYAVKGEQFIPDKPSVWIDKLPGTMWDLDPRNSKRVAVVTTETPSKAPQVEHEVVLLLNFFDYLRQRVPVGQ